jgi:hypothetical protein
MWSSFGGVIEDEYVFVSRLMGASKVSDPMLIHSGDIGRQAWYTASAGLAHCRYISLRYYVTASPLFSSFGLCYCIHALVSCLMCLDG